MNANELDWFYEMHKKDTVSPERDMNGETIYTLFLADFFKMPDVNFHDVAMVDAHLKSLFN